MHNPLNILGLINKKKNKDNSKLASSVMDIWKKGFVKKVKNDNYYIIVSNKHFFDNPNSKYDEEISKDFVRPIEFYGDKDKNGENNEYYKLNQIVVTNNNLDKVTYKDFGRIIGINTNNNKYEYFIKFQNNNISYFSREELKKSDTVEYFTNDIILYKDIMGIIYKGIIYNVSKNYQGKNHYDIIKIDEINSERIELTKNIEEKYVIKFLDVYLPSFKDIKYKVWLFFQNVVNNRIHVCAAQWQILCAQYFTAFLEGTIIKNFMNKISN